MIRTFTLCLAMGLGFAAKSEAQAVDLPARVEAAVEMHVLPAYARMARSTRTLSEAAGATCDPEDEALRAAFHTAFDSWVRVSHLRFGPSEADNRAFALAFWPDTRGKTPKALAGMIANEAPAGLVVADLMQQSIAAQGFYALDFLLYDPTLMTLGEATYRCALIQNLAGGSALRSEAIHGDWVDDYAAAMNAPTADGPYRSTKEAAGELVKAVATGLQFTDEARLARPLGTFEKPRPKRAEAWRSGRSQRHVVLALEATGELAVALAGETSAGGRIADGFATALNNADFEDPTFAGVADPIGRLKIESLQQYVFGLREEAVGELVDLLDVSIGFNALDGD